MLLAGGGLYVLLQKFVVDNAEIEESHSYQPALQNEAWFILNAHNIIINAYYIILILQHKSNIKILKYFYRKNFI